MEKVTVDICTRNRYNTALPVCLTAVALQTYLPHEVLIWDDADPSTRKDMREDPILGSLLIMLQQKGIQWNVVYGNGQGQVEGHRHAIKACKGAFIWRIDDDNIPEATCLEKLMSHFKDDVGAVGGLVLNVKGAATISSIASSKIEDTLLSLNRQWFRLPPGPDQDKPIEVDHLYSTFVYRKKDYYPTSLSRIGHREETIMTYRMKRDGWKLIVDPTAITWHSHLGTGGIRDGYHDMWARDEQVFAEMLKDWNIAIKQYKVIVLNNGIGDHYAFKNILPDLIKKYPDLVLAVCYPQVFHDFKVQIMSIAEANAAGFYEGVYKWMSEHNHKGSVLDAYKAMYLN